MLELIPYAIVYKLLTITKTHWGESNITCTLSMHSKQIISPLKNPRQRIVYTHQSMIRLFNNIKQKERYTLSHSPPKTKLKIKKNGKRKRKTTFFFHAYKYPTSYIVKQVLTYIFNPFT